MPPEVFVGKRPDEGLQPDGAIIVRHGIDIDNIGRYSDGWKLTFDDPNDVAHFVNVLADHVQLSRSDLVRIEPEALQVGKLQVGKDRVLTSLAQALTNNTGFGENEMLSLSFGNDELKTATAENMEFANQQVLNHTFLMLLPHASLNCLNEDYEVSIVYKTLNSLGLLDMANLKKLQSQAIKLAVAVERSSNVGDLKNVLQKVAIKGLEVDESLNPPDTTEREPVTPS